METAKKEKANESVTTEEVDLQVVETVKEEKEVNDRGSQQPRVPVGERVKVLVKIVEIVMRIAL